MRQTVDPANFIAQRLGKDITALIYRQIHTLGWQSLNKEYFRRVSVAFNGELLVDGMFCLNYRHKYGYGVYGLDKSSHSIVMRDKLPKNYW